MPGVETLVASRVGRFIWVAVGRGAEMEGRVEGSAEGTVGRGAAPRIALQNERAAMSNEAVRRSQTFGQWGELFMGGSGSSERSKDSG